MTTETERSGSNDLEAAKELEAWKTSKVPDLKSCFYAVLEANGKRLFGSVAVWSSYAITGDIILPFQYRPNHSRAVCLHNQGQFIGRIGPKRIYEELGLKIGIWHKDAVLTTSIGSTSDWGLYIITKPGTHFGFTNSTYLPPEQRIVILAKEIENVIETIKLRPVPKEELRLFTS